VGTAPLDRISVLSMMQGAFCPPYRQFRHY